MKSPFPKSTSSPGEGCIVVKSSPNRVSALESITYQYPLKLISPSFKHDQKSVLVFLLSYGGGLVGGDQVNLAIDLQPDARLSIVTQGHTKVFKPTSPNIVTRQTLQVEILDGAGLCLLPDPVQPFEASNYEQTQIFKLTGGASLCLLDWVTHGRSARGENWDLLRWVGRNEIWMSNKTNESKDRLLVRDTVILDTTPQAAPSAPLRDTMHGNAIFGTLLLRGPLTKSLGEFFLLEFAALPRLGARDFRTAKEKAAEESGSPLDRWRVSRLAQESLDNVLWSAARVRGCVVVKFGASTVEAGRNWIGSMLIQEGSTAANFGEDALILVWEDYVLVKGSGLFYRVTGLDFQMAGLSTRGGDTSSGSAAAEVDQLLTRDSLSRRSNQTSSPLIPRTPSPTTRRGFIATNYHRIQFVLHREDPQRLEYWIDNPERRIRQVLVQSDLSWFQMPTYDLVEFQDIRLTAHVDFMSEEQLIRWLQRLLVMRPGVSDNWFLFD
ncbi:hypothetical protein JX265_011884 [Neoarthrinium moseri]|uniref:Urease accessory protein n=1 Tax=Neoarthrinium moseri TaxID=1658444 RepID=A0A9Q0AKD9_9PEZI|nr:hypothetical protein JX265_011884 [Neoarthrinium moseri]